MARRSRSSQVAPELEGQEPEMGDEQTTPEVLEMAEQGPPSSPAMNPPPAVLEQADERLGPPTADELFASAPSVDDLMAIGFGGKPAAQIHRAFMAMVGEVRKILAPGLVPQDSVRVHSTEPSGHWRLKRKWTQSPVLFAPDDPFLSPENVKVLQDDPRIKIKFPE